ncbi:MAG: DinB family protein [Gammaproteobacteria bacterium]
MSSAENLQTLTSYKAWANERLYRSLDGISDSDLAADRKTRLGSILATLNHLYAIDLVWQAHLENRSHGFSTRRPILFRELSDLRSAQNTIDRWYIDYTSELNPDRAETVVDFEFIDGGRGTISRAEILIHVVNHATYHRGHVTDAMLEIPMRPPVTDFPVYLRDLS